ncbi:MAG: Oxidoreductase, short-chain dehydrogenase/reductase family [Devosia sp.]|nr:Oxidoreductase, short-chain dehydrogenase/reductase family [Devosia sp.]
MRPQAFAEGCSLTIENDLTGRVILVTGASRGIGYATARELGRRGAHVVAVARTVGGLEELDDEINAAGGSATLVPLDLRDFDAIDRLGATIFERFKKLDGLVGNAAMLGTITPLGHMRPAEFERLFALNVTVNFRLVRSFDLLLRQSNAARVVFLTAGPLVKANPYFGPYHATKAALETLAAAYAAEMKSTSVKINAFHPGPLRTRLRVAGWPGEDPAQQRPPETVAPAIADLLSPAYAYTGMLIDFPTGTTEKLLGAG